MLKNCRLRKGRGWSLGCFLIALVSVLIVDCTRIEIGENRTLGQQTSQEDHRATQDGNHDISEAPSHAIDVREYGAVGDGIADDTAALDHAFAASARGGGPVYLPSGVYRTDGHTVAHRISIFGDGATLKFNNTPAEDHVLKLQGDGSYVRGLTVDGNGPKLSEYTGAGHGIVLEGKNTMLISVRSQHNQGYPAHGHNTGHSFVINAAGCVLENCHSYRAGYAGFRTGEYGGGIATLYGGWPHGTAILRNCTAEMFAAKGYVNRGHAGLIVLDNFSGSPLPEEEGGGLSTQEVILFESGKDARVDTVILKNSIIRAQPTSNLVKSVNVRRTIIDSCVLEVEGVALLRIQNQHPQDDNFANERVIIRYSYLKGTGSLVNFDSQPNENMETLTIDSTTLESDGVDAIDNRVGYVFIRNVRLSGALSRYFIRSEVPPGAFKACVVEDLHSEAESARALIGFVGEDAPPVGTVKAVNIHGIDIGPHSGSRQLIQINKTSRSGRLFELHRTMSEEDDGLYSIDRGVGWKVGDTILSRSPSQDELGYVCIIGGHHEHARFARLTASRPALAK